jgi:hypothetical protein
MRSDENPGSRPGCREKFIERDGKTFVDRHFHNKISSFLSMWASNNEMQG